MLVVALMRAASPLPPLPAHLPQPHPSHVPPAHPHSNPPPSHLHVDGGHHKLDKVDLGLGARGGGAVAERRDGQALRALQVALGEELGQHALRPPARASTHARMWVFVGVWVFGGWGGGVCGCLHVRSLWG